MEYSLKHTESFRGKKQIEQMKQSLEVGKVYKVKGEELTERELILEESR